MIKNKTEYFPSNIIKFIPSTQVNISKKEKKKEIEYKINQELNSNIDEFKNKLKRSLQKNEITKEVFLSKNISKDKRCQPNLLISQIDNSEKFMMKKKKFLAKISKENKYFLKTYKRLKNIEAKLGKKGSQHQYLNDLVELYKHKNYNLNNIEMNYNDNIFKYSVLTDLDFGNDVNNDLIRILQEIGYNEYLKEQKLAFKFKNEIFKDRIKYPAEPLIIFKINKKTDYGLDDKSKIKERKNQLNLKKSKEINKEKKEDDNKMNKDYNEEENKKKIINNINNDNQQKLNIYSPIKNDIKKSPKNLLNSDKTKNEYKDKKLTQFKELFKSKLLFLVNNNSFNGKSNQNEKVNETNDNNNKEKENPVILYNNTETDDKTIRKIKPILILKKEKKKQNKKINFVKTNNMNKYSLQNKLPDIKKSLINSRNEMDKKLLGNNTTNYSVSKSKLSTHELKLDDNLIGDKNSLKKNKIINIKKDRSMSINSLYNDKITKTPVKEIELTKELEKFKNRRPKLYKSFLNNTNEINIQGFTKHFQRITQENNFGNIYNKNKYLKKHNFSNLISNDLLSDDEQEGRNVQKVDKKIKNIIYDSADYLLGNYIINKDLIDS